jgi:hypothetical protein
MDIDSHAVGTVRNAAVTMGNYCDWFLSMNDDERLCMTMHCDTLYDVATRYHT